MCNACWPSYELQCYLGSTSEHTKTKTWYLVGDAGLLTSRRHYGRKISNQEETSLLNIHFGLLFIKRENKLNHAELIE